MTDSVIIIGCGGNHLDVLEALPDSQKCLGFLDDNPELRNRRFAGLPVLGPLSKAADYPGGRFVLALAGYKSHLRRREILASAAAAANRFLTVVSPAASLSPRAKLGSGSVVSAGTRISSGCRIGSFNYHFQNVVVNHDVVIEDHVILASGVLIGGGCRIGADSFIGQGANLRDGITIGRGCLVGMGAVVLKDLPDGSLAYGSPARISRSHHALA